MVEKKYRSIIKTISWRLTGTIDTIIISFLITGNFSMAFSIGSIEVITKMILYYLHERAWSKINIGRKVLKEDYQI
ncbi:DUF2061 domain-containing protein [Deferribacter autotrophicus]|uniref:DUF2061 domain-containing protein n=1 Tax=Deferribacter autotrophicus TaxID=500465 RepID=A0A5A8F2X2_9BACT|nr:DUF2061 domain-containing protein [Deferribacter autotrophicus]